MPVVEIDCPEPVLISLKEDVDTFRKDLQL